MHGFHYLPCPLCQLNVVKTKPDCYRAFPLNFSYAKLFFDNNWHWDTTTESIQDGDFTSCTLPNSPSLNYGNRSLLLHRKCFDLIRGWTYPQIYHLINVIEPTFLDQSLPPNSEHGAFSFQDLSLLPPSSTLPQLLDRLPPEIRDMVLVLQHHESRL